MPKRARPRDPASAPGPEELADRLHSLAIHLLRRLRAQDAASGLTGPRLSALSVIVFGGPLTIGDLAAAEQVRPPTMTHIVRALERQRLVRREPDPADRRVVRLHPTARGRTLLVAGRRRRVRQLAERLAELTPVELDALAVGADVLATVVPRLT
jgi:DNA-binding MarR family transcriptional regulator